MPCSTRVRRIPGYFQISENLKMQFRMEAFNDTIFRKFQVRPNSRRWRLITRKPEDISSAEGVSRALSAILVSAAHGEITIGEAVQLANLLEIRRQTIETQEFERRLGEIEERIESRQR